MTIHGAEAPLGSGTTKTPRRVREAVRPGGAVRERAGGEGMTKKAGIGVMNVYFLIADAPRVDLNAVNHSTPMLWYKAPRSPPEKQLGRLSLVRAANATRVLWGPNNRPPVELGPAVGLGFWLEYDQPQRPIASGQWKCWRDL